MDNKFKTEMVRLLIWPNAVRLNFVKHNLGDTLAQHPLSEIFEVFQPIQATKQKNKLMRQHPKTFHVRDNGKMWTARWSPRSESSSWCAKKSWK